MRSEQIRAQRTKNLRVLQRSYTWEEIADKCGVSAAYLSQIANEVTQAKGVRPRRLSDNYAEKIEHGLGLEPGWFDREHETVDAKPPIDRNTAASPDSSHNLSGAVGDNIRHQTFIPKMVPRISTVSAGPWAEIADNHPPGFGEDIDYCPVPCSDGTVSFVVSGDSMTSPYGPDTFPHGTTIFVDPNISPENGSFVIAKVNGEAEVTFKQFVVDGPRRFLKPLNSIYPLINEEFRVLGVVVASQRLHR